MKTCRICKKEKPEDEFYENRAKKLDGSTYVSLRTECRLCTDARTREYHRDNRDRVIFNNCKKASKSRGIPFSLTREQIKRLIESPCRYCGDSRPEKIGLDRVENRVGYVITNVVPCCVRCNTMKRDMPYEAWEFLAPMVKQAFEKGLFGEWAPHTSNNQLGFPKRRGPKSLDKRLRANRNPPTM